MDTCLIYITDYIESEISKGNLVGMVALDVQKTFDCVNHNTLCSKLELMGINSTWLISYLFNRNQIVKVNGEKSNPKTISVTQGNILGPLQK